MFARRIILALLLFVQAHVVAAQDFGISEIRGGIMLDEVEIYSKPPVWFMPQPQTISLGNISSVSFDVLFRSPEIDAFRWIGSPRPTIGATLNFKHESLLHAGLTWRVQKPGTKLFGELELGGALHNGAISGVTKPFRNFGCPYLFYVAISFGLQLTESTSLMVTEQHGSQWGTCGWANNDGINFVGVRLGQKF